MKKKPSGPAESRAFSFEVKEFDDANGIIRGYANTYDRDAYGDEVQPGAFKRTLDHKRGTGKRIPIFSQHDPTLIIGYVDPAKAYEDTKGLWIEVQMLMKIQQAQDDYERAKAGLMSFSIGFDTLEAEVDPKTKTRKIFEIRLWEVSLVTFPANEHAVVTDVKAMSFSTTLRQSQAEDNLWKRWWQLGDALGETLSAIMRDTSVPDGDKVPLIEQCMAEYGAAITAWCRDAIASGIYTDQKSGLGPTDIKAGRKFSAASVSTMTEAMQDAKSAYDKLAALLKMDEPDEADPSDDGDADAETGKKKSAPTPGPDADVARLASEIKAAADETKALNAIRDLQRSMSAK